MRRTLCLLAALLVLPSLGSDSPKGYDGATEDVSIEGSWRAVKCECDGQQKIIVTGEEVQVFRRGNWSIPAFGLEGTYRIDPTNRPAHLDQTVPVKGQQLTHRLIYQTDGHTLRIAHQFKDATVRPSGFHGEGVCVTTYERVK